MITVPSIVTIVKYGFLSLVVTGAGFLIANTTVMTIHQASTAEQFLFRPKRPLLKQSSRKLISVDFSKCLFHPRKFFCAISQNRRQRILNKTALQILKDRIPEDALWPVLHDFVHVAHSVQVRPVLLEPSVLFCMLTPRSKTLLLARGFHPAYMQGSARVLTMGLTGDEGRTLLKHSDFLQNNGFSINKIPSTKSQTQPNVELASTHYLITKQDYSIHVVLLYEFKLHIWHDGLSTEQLDEKNFLYDKPSVFENITLLELQVANTTIAIPSDPFFLLRLQKSVFKECSTGPEEINQMTPSNLSLDALKNRVQIALQEMESILRPLFIDFWIWGDSLEGWLKDCNIFQKTVDLSVAVSSSSLSNSSFTELFDDNEYLTFLDHFQMASHDVLFTYDCHGLKIKIFLVFEENQSFFTFSDSIPPSKLTVNSFPLCTADILDQIVFVPCYMNS